MQILQPSNSALSLSDHVAYSNTLVYAKVCASLRCAPAVDFVTRTFTSHYSKYFSEEFARKTVSESLRNMASSQSQGINIQKLKECLHAVTKNSYSLEKNPSFFLKYENYKTTEKPAYYYASMVNEILGIDVLDFGSGKGHLTKLLARNGYHATGCDVLDYSEIDTSDIPFIQIENAGDIESKIKPVDTTLIITVLHHIAAQSLLPMLTELSRITKRILIIEDVLDPEFFNTDADTTDELTKSFMSLSPEARKHACNLADFYGNVVTQGLSNMNFPFEFKTIPEWHNLLKEAGFETTKTVEIGIPKVSFHGIYQALLVCDSVNFQGK